MILHRRLASPLLLGFAIAALWGTAARGQEPQAGEEPPNVIDGALHLAGALLPPPPDRSGEVPAPPPAVPPAPREPDPAGMAPPAAEGGQPQPGTRIDGDLPEPAEPDGTVESAGGDAAAAAPEPAAGASGEPASGSAPAAAGAAGAAAAGLGASEPPPAEPEREARRGALDRIVSAVPWSLDLLIALLVALLALMTVRSARDRKRLEEALRMALTDGLTGLPNRQDAERTLERMAAGAQRSGRPLSIALLDLDHFKAINDDFGHPAGDATLRGVAKALRSELRAADHVGRLGGEEFVAILPDTGPEEAYAVAERIRERVAAMPRRVDRRVTASLGVASLPGDATSTGELMAAADRALYAAKEAGRDQVVWAGALDSTAEGREPVPA